MLIEIIFFENFKDRIQLTQKLQAKQKCKIEVCGNYLYVETKIKLN